MQLIFNWQPIDTDMTIGTKSTQEKRKGKAQRAQMQCKKESKRNTQVEQNAKRIKTTSKHQEERKRNVKGTQTEQSPSGAHK